MTPFLNPQLLYLYEGTPSHEGPCSPQSDIPGHNPSGCEETLSLKHINTFVSSWWNNPFCHFSWLDSLNSVKLKDYKALASKYQNMLHKCHNNSNTFKTLPSNLSSSSWAVCVTDSCPRPLHHCILLITSVNIHASLWQEQSSDIADALWVRFLEPSE